MKILICRTLAIFFLILPNAKALTKSCNNKITSLKVEFKLDKSIVNLGEKINVLLTLRNSGKENLQLPSFMELESYWLRFTVFNENNERIRWLGPEVKMIEGEDRIALDEGYFWGREIKNFEQRYDFSKSGRYRIRAIYGISPDGDCPFGRAVSDWVVLIIK